MSFLDSLLNGLGQKTGNLPTGGLPAGDVVGGLNELIQSQGGLGGLITKLGQGGLSDSAASWIGGGANQAISAEQIAQVLGNSPIAAFAQRLGISTDQAAQVLASALPVLIDRLTPGGNLSETSGNPLNDLLENIPGGIGGALGSLFKR